MENFNQIFTLVANNYNIDLNFNILETGLINILVLFGILIYVGRDFLGSILEKRRSGIVQDIQDAEDRLNEANNRLSEAHKQLNQATVVINKIKSEAVKTKLVLLESDEYESKKELAIRFNRALANFRSKEQQIFLEVKQQIILLVLKRTVTRIKDTFCKKDKVTMLVNETIDKLKGDLL